ncbi:LysR family transcriptional regulator [Burkholderia cepacia]|nr:LysR family transcriptional regulator [Burkholderia cepacia]
MTGLETVAAVVEYLSFSGTAAALNMPSAAAARRVTRLERSTDPLLQRSC